MDSIKVKKIAELIEKIAEAKLTIRKSHDIVSYTGGGRITINHEAMKSSLSIKVSEHMFHKFVTDLRDDAETELKYCEEQLEKL